MYILCSLGIALTVRWTDPHLPFIPGGNPIPRGAIDGVPPRIEGFKSESATVIAIYRYLDQSLAGFVNGCLIFSIASAANTSLYVASRTLYGLVYGLDDSNFLV